MRRMRIMGRLSIVAILAMCGASASATSYGDDVTLWDNVNGTTSWTGGNTNPDPRTDVLGDPMREDNEVEPGALGLQLWDLEGMYFDSGANILTLAGGYDFQNGATHNGTIFAGGDIFLAVNPTFGSGPGQIESPNNNGSDYDYVIALGYDANDIADGTYQVYDISGLTVGAGLLGVTTITGSNPWRYSSGGTAVAGASGNVSFNTYADDAAFHAALGAGVGEYEPIGGIHQVMSGFDLSWLVGSGSIYAHYTMQCGNDLLTGYIPVVPLPGAALMGLLGGIAVLAKRRFGKGAITNA